MAFWDDVTPPPTGGDWFKFTRIGDEVAGRIESLGIDTYKGKKSAELKIQTKVRLETVVASPRKLAEALAEMRPDVGDFILIRMTGIMPTANGDMKLFDVERVEPFELAEAPPLPGAKAPF